MSMEFSDHLMLEKSNDIKLIRNGVSSVLEVSLCSFITEAKKPFTCIEKGWFPLSDLAFFSKGGFDFFL